MAAIFMASYTTLWDTIRAGAAVVHPTGRGVAGGLRLRCRLVPQRDDRHGDFAVHPIPPRPEGADPARRGPLPTTPQDREHVRPIEGLAADRNPLRPLPHPVPLGLPAGSHGHLLVMRLEPKAFPLHIETYPAA